MPDEFDNAVRRSCRMGLTLAHRHAERWIVDCGVRWSQGQQVRNFTNVGPAPLFYASMVGKLGQDWRLLGAAGCNSLCCSSKLTTAVQFSKLRCTATVNLKESGG